MLLSNVWANLINLFARWIVNYGWTIIVFTIVLKLVLSPLDILQRHSSTKQQRVMAYMQPEINAINEKYAGNKERINAETSKIYKKYNTGRSEKLYESYHELDTTYVEATVEWNAWEESEQLEISEQNYALQKTQEKYDELSEANSWLWVKNVWKADTNTSQFVDVDDYISHYGITEADAEAVRARYETITASIIGDGNDQNGYFVLIVLSALISFLSQFLSAKLMNPKGQKMNTTMHRRSCSFRSHRSSQHRS